MKVVVIYGQIHHGNTYKYTEEFLKGLDCKEEDIHRIVLKDIPHCVGCFQCIMKSENCCPHREIVQPIMEAMCVADVIVLSSPTYCYSMTSQMKAFVDHMAHRWMVHRPYDFRNKIGVAISTAAGAGHKQTVKDMKRQLFWWSVGKSYGICTKIWAADLDHIPEKRKKKIFAEAGKVAHKVNKKAMHVKPGIRTKFLIMAMRKIHLKNNDIPIEQEYWKGHFLKQ